MTRLGPKSGVGRLTTFERSNIETKAPVKKAKTKSLPNKSRATRFIGMNWRSSIHVTTFGPTRLIAGSLVFVAMGCWMDSEASASCGDYLVTGDQDLAMSAGVTSADAGVGATPMSGEHHPTRPCDGPECSGKPLFPSAPVVLVLMERDFGWLSIPKTEFEFARSVWGLCAKQSLPDPIGVDIFHPPRRIRV
jgi:hypothetical protein